MGAECNQNQKGEDAHAHSRRHRRFSASSSSHGSILRAGKATQRTNKRGRGYGERADGPERTGPTCGLCGVDAAYSTSDGGAAHSVGATDSVGAHDSVGALVVTDSGIMATSLTVDDLPAP
eukprot:GHVU01188275.1.p2 GENE.GHVU01188275.1~~GHVU01188275.1.p2  ORF type:complete len:121 (-),score=9.52 GHVU01188275.1:157-519(-)